MFEGKRKVEVNSEWRPARIVAAETLVLSFCNCEHTSWGEKGEAILSVVRRHWLSKNHRMSKIGRDHNGSCGLTCQLKQGHPRAQEKTPNYNFSILSYISNKLISGTKLFTVNFNLDPNILKYWVILF